MPRSAEQTRIMVIPVGAPWTITTMVFDPKSTFDQMLTHWIEGYTEHIYIFVKTSDGGTLLPTTPDKYATFRLQEKNSIRKLDMFVDDAGGPKMLPLNPIASALYGGLVMNNRIVRGPTIYGPAVIFLDRAVWR